MIRRLNLGMRLVQAASAAALSLGAVQAQAADCSELPNVVYVTGSSAAKPFIGAVAANLSGVTLVYQKADSCVGVNAILANTKITGKGSTFTWDAAKYQAVEVKEACDLPLAGATVDIGVSDVFGTSCPGVTALPSDVKDYLGPIQTMTFAVPATSKQSSISAEAAYLVYGLGASGEVSPWYDDTLINQRSSSSGTQLMIAAAINVQAAKWKGTANKDSDVMVASLAAAATAGNQDKAIGILATDRADFVRESVKVLAYQHYGQSCGYFPDSDATTYDKANVRDGHYMIWGPLHLLTHVQDGVPVNANAKTVLDILSGAAEPAFDLLKVEAKGSVIPDCAMRVKRDSEGGPLMSYMPAKSCECKYVAETDGRAPAHCQSCGTDAECTGSAKKCNYGYCEVQ